MLDDRTFGGYFPKHIRYRIVDSMKIIKFVLLAFIVNFLLIHHLFISLNLLMISTVRVFKFEWYINKPVLSANSRTSFCLISLYMHISFIYVAKIWTYGCKSSATI